MITFKEYLAEETKLPDLIKVLERDCKPFIDIARGNGLLVRGIATLGNDKITCAVPWEYDDGPNEDGVYTADLYKKAVRTDRRPRDSSKQMHDLIDAWFKENFGYNVRTESMFAFAAHGGFDTMHAAYKEARRYAEHVCTVFPIGDFKYVWSEDIDDLFSEAPLLSNADDANKFLNSANYTSQGLQRALKTSKREVMIKCDSYYAIDWMHVHGIAEWLKTV